MFERKTKLTKKEVLELHKEMWNWIADNISNHNYNVTKLKKEFCEMKGIQAVNNCFCCEYGAQLTGSSLSEDRCPQCPVLWGTEDEHDKFFCEGYDEKGLYARIMIAECEGDFETAIKLARQIANLKAK